MTGKMKWERVRVEELSRRHGSEWVPFSDSEHPPIDLPFASTTSKQSTRRNEKRHRIAVPLATPMVGCSCGKPIGFQGQHRKRCPLCRVQASIRISREAHQSEEEPQSERRTSVVTRNGGIAPTRKPIVKQKQGRAGGLQFEVTMKGGVSVHGLGRFPVTLYYEQWARLFDATQQLHTFLETNKTKLKLRQ